MFNGSYFVSGPPTFSPSPFDRGFDTRDRLYSFKRDNGVIDFHVAIESNNLDEVEKYVRANRHESGKMNGRDMWLRSPLITASQNGFTSIVALLLSVKCVMVNAKERYNLTALEIAQARGHKEIIQLFKIRERIDLALTELNGQLTRIDLSGISLKNIQLEKVISDRLEDLNSPKTVLRALNLSNTEPNIAALQDLSKLLEAYPNLEELNLDKNLFGGRFLKRKNNQPTRIELLAKILQGNHNLKKISLKNTSIDDRDSEALCEMIESMASLAELNFSELIITRDNKNTLINTAKNARKWAALVNDEAHDLPDNLPFKIHAIARHEEDKFGPELLDEKGEVLPAGHPNVWKEYAGVTKNILKSFIPFRSQRISYIKNKEESSWTVFEKMQLRAEAKMHVLNDIAMDKQNPNAHDYSILISILEEVFGGDIAFGTPDVIREWIQVCQAAKTDIELRDVIRATAFDDQIYQTEQVRFFGAYIGKILHPIWVTSAAIEGPIISIDNPITNTEKGINFVKSFVHHAALGIHGIYELKDIFSAAHAVQKSVGSEIAAGSVAGLHTLSLAGEVFEHTPGLRYLMHLVEHGAEYSFESIYKGITGKSWLDTEQRLSNFYASFTGVNPSKDFSDKISAFEKDFEHLFGRTLDKLTAVSAGYLAKACCQHLTMGLMTGIFKGGDLGLPRGQFVDLARRWLTSVPMENPPILKLKDGRKVSADVFLRSPKLRCMINGREIEFQWKPHTITLMGNAKKYLGSHDYSSDPGSSEIGYEESRYADVQEVEQLIAQLESAQPEQDAELIIRGGGRSEIARSAWELDLENSPDIRNLVGQNIGSIQIKAISYKWRSNEEKIDSNSDDIRDIRGFLAEHDLKFDRIIKTVVALQERVDKQEDLIRSHDADFNVQEGQLNVLEGGLKKSDDKAIALAKNKAGFFYRSVEVGRSYIPDVRCTIL